MENSNFDRSSYSFEMNDEQARFVEACSRNEFFDSDCVWLDDSEDREFEDDGCYHVVRSGVRVGFNFVEEYSKWPAPLDNGFSRNLRSVKQFVRRELGNAS